MSKFNFKNTNIEGLTVIEPKLFEDKRGYFMETYNYSEFKNFGLDMNFVQDNQSKSSKGVLRGLHFQVHHQQGKLVRVLKGKVFDVAVDLRENSPTYGKWYGIYLSQNNKKMLYVPEGFAHGFLVISDETIFSYKCTDFYHSEDEAGIIYNDPIINIEWPIEKVNEIYLSKKDQNLPSLKTSDYKL